MIGNNDKLFEVISKNIDLLPIVNRFGIKSGMEQKTIAAICKEKNIDTKFFLSILNTFDSADYFPEVNEIELSSLVEFLTNTHQYIRSTSIPRLRHLLSNLKTQNPESKFNAVVEKYFNDYITNLNKHIDYEEKEIFPLAKKWKNIQSKKSGNDVKKLFKEHENVENEISDLLSIIIQYIPQNADIQLIHEILHALSHFEKEQKDHARFEDKILVPKLLALIN